MDKQIIDDILEFMSILSNKLSHTNTCLRMGFLLTISVNFLSLCQYHANREKAFRPYRTVCRNAFHAAGECRRHVKNVTHFVKKISKLWNFMTLFGITMRNALK